MASGHNKDNAGRVPILRPSVKVMSGEGIFILRVLHQVSISPV